MSKPSKFIFVPASHIGDSDASDGGSYCSYNAKTSMLTFQKKNPDIESYCDAWVKLYVDRSKQTLAWKFLEHEPRENMTDYTKIKKVVNAAGWSVKVYVPKKIADVLGVLKGMDYSGMRIRQYAASLLDPVPFNYVTFEAKHPKLRKKKAV